MGRSIHTKPAVSAWLIRERKRLGWKPRDVAESLTARGLPVQEGTVRTWEAGRNPSPENVEGLEAIFESRSPASGPGDATPLGLDALLGRLDRQADTIDQLIEQNAILIKMLVDRAVAEPPERPPSESGPEARSRLTRGGKRGGNVGPLDADRYDEPIPIPSDRTATGTGY